LVHDIANWQSRLNGYQGELHREYSCDAIVGKALSMETETAIQVTEISRRITDSETLGDDVELLSQLDSLSSSLGSVDSDCAEGEGLASSSFRMEALGLGQARNEIMRELKDHILRFYGHTLNRASWADGILKDFPGWDEGSAWKLQPRNATGWNALGDMPKLKYIQYYLDGFGRGIIEGAILGAVFSQEGKGKVSLPRIEPARIARQQATVRDQIGKGKHTTKVGEIAEGISAFYRDPQNRNVCWDDAFKFSAM
jgi:hypothetical protein